MIGMRKIACSRNLLCWCILLLLCFWILVISLAFEYKAANKQFSIANFLGFRDDTRYSILTSKLTKINAYESYDNDTGIEEELRRRIQAAKKKKIILVWSHSAIPMRPFITNRTRCGNCLVTQDRSVIRDQRTAAVVYYFDSYNISDMPTPRNPNHLHIFWTMESSSTLNRSGYSLEASDSYGMNATMTYRLDSDFLTSYQSWAMADKEMGKSDSDITEILATKSKLAVCIISNCEGTSGASARLKKIKQLKELGLKIDTFGKCFSNNISFNDALATIPPYKFYLAFENSYHCKDYITEKFFVYAFVYSRSVPIVWGAKREDYEKIAPPGSFIFADDFSVPAELVDYLEFLNNNEKEYLKFFRWRKLRPKALPLYNMARGFCAICRAANGINVDRRFNPKYNSSAIPLFTDGVAHMTVPSLRQRIYEDENPECFLEL